LDALAGTCDSMHIRRASYISGGVARVEQKIRDARNRICKKPNESRSKIFILFRMRNREAQQRGGVRTYELMEDCCESGKRCSGGTVWKRVINRGCTQMNADFWGWAGAVEGHGERDEGIVLREGGMIGKRLGGELMAGVG
jgi:hypothetical protein